MQNFAGTGIAGTCSSDAALKRVKENVSGVLNNFANLQLVKFDWNKKAANVYHNSTAVLNTGYIAKAVERQFPELVSIDDKGYRQIDYTTLSLYGLEAIKELKAVNDKQAVEIADLKSEFSKGRSAALQAGSAWGFESLRSNTLLLQRSASQTGHCTICGGLLPRVSHPSACRSWLLSVF